VVTHGLAAAGLKGYVQRRLFIISDVRIAFGARLEEALVRVGFGVDF
jgi:hypothetical protein